MENKLSLYEVLSVNEVQSALSSKELNEIIKLKIMESKSFGSGERLIIKE